METILNKIISGIATIGIAISSLFGFTPDNNINPPVVYTENQQFGTTAPEQTIGGFTYNLAGAGVSSSATSITLQSLTLPQSGYEIQDSDLADTFYITLEPGNRTKQEIASCTTVTQNANNSATLSGCVRGLAPITPYTASTTYAFPHSGGSQVIFSDPPQLFEDIIAYIDDVAISGSPNASTIQKGIVEIATQAEVAASGTTGSTGAILVIPSSVATTTYYSSGSNQVVVTGGTNKIDNNFIATSTLFTNATFASTTTFTTGIPFLNIGKNIQVITTTGTSTFAIPSGVTKLKVQVQGAGGAGGNGVDGGSNDAEGSGGGAGGYSMEYVDVSATSTVQVYVGTAGQWSTFGTNGFYLSATGGSAGATGGSGGTGGTGSGGDLNLKGGDGNPGLVSSTGATGGMGGTSFLGGGGRGGNGSVGGDGGNYGGGGGGGDGESSRAGGAGAQGAVIIEW